KRSAKSLLASREAYVDTAVGYVEVKREGNSSTVKCRLTPKHKVKAKFYQVTAVIDESVEKIITVECNDCVASAGGYKHAICFAIWLIKWSYEPSTTSIQCYWSKPKLAGAGKAGRLRTVGAFVQLSYLRNATRWHYCVRVFERPVHVTILTAKRGGIRAARIVKTSRYVFSL
ncbi:hypothetical protein SFRURICE_014983, partial [Spodoptera frugiperda]